MAAKIWDVKQAEFLTSAVEPGKYPKPALPQVAFAGRSNVGKSSLLNLLTRRKNLAKTSGKPGHTRLVNFFLVNGDRHFVDLPGYGFAKVPPAEQERWARMIEAYLNDNAHLRLLVMLLDARRTPSQADDQLVEFLGHAGVPTLLVMTKCDKLKRAALERSRRDIAKHYGLPDGLLPIATSAETGAGREELLKAVLDAIEHA